MKEYYTNEDFDLEKIKNEVLAEMESYPEHVTLDDIRQWLAEHRNEISGRSTYGVKHSIEEDYGNERKQKMCYCANNWVKYVVVETDHPVKHYVKCRKKYIPVNVPTPENVMDNSVNYIFD